MISLRLCLLKYPAEATAIRAAFRSLEERIGPASLYQTHAWFRHTVDGPQPPGSGEVRVLQIESPDGISAVIPLARTPSRIGPLTLNTLSIPWHRGDSSSIQFAGDLTLASALPSIRRFLASEWPGWDALVWPKQLPLSSARLPEGPAAAPLAVSVQSGTILTIPVSPDPGAFFVGLSTKARAGLRNARNRLKGHAVEYQVHEYPGPAMTEALDAFLVLEGAGWKQLSDARWPNFHALMAEMSAAGRFRIYQIWIDGTLAASLLAMEGPPGRLSVYKITYDEGMARLSPGRLLVYHVIEDAAHRGDTGLLDMMSPASWLSPWAPIPEALLTLWCFRPTPRGLAGFLAMAGWAVAGPVVRRRRKTAA